MSHINTKRLQVIWDWWPGEWGMGFHRVEGPLAAIYRWSFCVGPVTVRRWQTNLTPDELTAEANDGE